MSDQKRPERTDSRGDKKSTPAQDSEDALLKQRVEGNKDAAKIKKIAEDIGQGP